MNSAQPVRFGYVGCGFVTQTIHIPNFRSLPDCQFLALAEARPRLGKSVAARYGIPNVYTSHEEMAADPAIEAVGVSAAYALQGQIAETCCARASTSSWKSRWRFRWPARSPSCAQNRKAARA